ncbi:esterase/lipase family protein [Corynebacterium qintianiae]|uniref:esterase/lipase family protein n=1 Tax=Corynebacterium qintianiae TaxID=2709392 RepID=UPI0013EAB1D4|nr:alpha/beta hydrolase [Corynebacterium qintianiae]
MALFSHLPRVLPDPSTATSQSRGRVVVAVHGTLSEPFAFRPLAAALSERGVDMSAPSHGKRGTALIDASSNAIADTITSLPAAVTRVDVVGHSSGALIALRALSNPAVAERVHTLVGLGAAWRGTAHRAWYRPDWLVRLFLGESFAELENVGEPVSPAGVEVVSVVSDADTVVPGWSSSLGRVVHVAGVPHRKLPGCTGEVLRVLGL